MQLTSAIIRSLNRPTVYKPINLTTYELFGTPCSGKTLLLERLSTSKRTDILTSYNVDSKTDLVLFSSSYLDSRNKIQFLFSLFWLALRHPRVIRTTYLLTFSFLRVVGFVGLSRPILFNFFLTLSAYLASSSNGLSKLVLDQGFSMLIYSANIRSKRSSSPSRITHFKDVLNKEFLTELNILNITPPPPSTIYKRLLERRGSSHLEKLGSPSLTDIQNSLETASCALEQLRVAGIKIQSVNNTEDINKILMN